MDTNCYLGVPLNFVLQLSMTIMINIMLHLFSVLFELSEFPSINEESVDVLNKETVVYVSAIELNICGA